MTRFKNILIPVDFSACSEQALGVALSMAGKDSTLHLLHVADLKTTGSTYESNDATRAEMAAIEQDEGALAEELRSVAKRLREQGELGEPEGQRVNLRVANGEPAANILGSADELGVDLIVMGSHGRKGFKDLLLGSTTEQVVRRANCSVMAVKPEGYPYLRD